MLVIPAAHVQLEAPRGDPLACTRACGRGHEAGPRRPRARSCATRATCSASSASAGSACASWPATCWAWTSRQPRTTRSRTRVPRSRCSASTSAWRPRAACRRACSPCTAGARRTAGARPPPLPSVFSPACPAPAASPRRVAGAPACVLLYVQQQPSACLSSYKHPLIRRLQGGLLMQAAHSNILAHQQALPARCRC